MQHMFVYLMRELERHISLHNSSTKTAEILLVSWICFLKTSKLMHVYHTASICNLSENELAAASAPIANPIQLNTTEPEPTAHEQAQAYTLPSANATDETGAELLTTPGNAIDPLTAEFQMGGKQGETGLNGTRTEHPENDVVIDTTPANSPALKFQNSSPTSKNHRESSEKRRQRGYDFDNHQPRSRRPILSPARTNAVAGPSRATSQRFRPSSANLLHIEEDYPNVFPYGNTGRPLKPHYSTGDFLYAKQMQMEFDEELAQYDQLEENIQSPFKCGVCMDEQPEDYVTLLDPCRHKFCRDCVKNHIIAQLSQRRFPILCPVCKAERGKRNPGSAYTAFLREGINGLILSFSDHRCSCSASWHHGKPVQDMGRASNGEVFGSS